MVKKIKNNFEKKIDNYIEENTSIITLNEYLSKFYNKKKLENVIRKWYQKKHNKIFKRTKEDWDKVLQSFHNEKENI